MQDKELHLILKCFDDQRIYMEQRYEDLQVNICGRLDSLARLIDKKCSICKNTERAKQQIKYQWVAITLLGVGLSTMFAYLFQHLVKG